MIGRKYIAPVVMCAFLVPLAGCSGSGLNDSPPATTMPTSLTATVSSPPETSATIVDPPAPPPPTEEEESSLPEVSPTTSNCFDPADYSDSWNFGYKEVGSLQVSGEIPGNGIFGVQYLHRECFDRVVVDVVPGVDVKTTAKYARPPRHDGSDLPFELAGDAGIQMVVQAPTQDQLVGFHTPIDGLPVLREIQLDPPNEGFTTIGIGLADEVPFQLTSYTDEDKTQVIIDFYTG